MLDPVPAQLDRYTTVRGEVHLTGIQALVRLVLDQRRDDITAGRSTAAFISGYEGSPLAGYDTELLRNASLLDEHEIVFVPAVNEELAATAVQGTQLAAMQPDKRVGGVAAVWYGKSPGLDRAADAIRHANLMGTHPEGGVLALVGDDPSAKSSSVPGASELLLADLGLPILYPADPQQALDFGRHGIAMSRCSGLWVAMKIVTNVADGSCTVDMDPGRVRPVVPDLKFNGVMYRHEVTARLAQPGLGELERSRDGSRLEIARRYAAVNGLNDITRRAAGDRIGVVAAGKSYLDLAQAMRMLGVESGVRVLRLGMIHPIEPNIVTEFAEGLEHIIVVEEKRPLIEMGLKDILYGVTDSPMIHGKRNPDGDSMFPTDGELDPEVVAEHLAPMFARFGVLASARPRTERRLSLNLPIVSRTPYFCSGCPHNISTKIPDGSTVGAGIGCHALVTLMDERQVGDVIGMTQMGGEGSQWIGMAPFLHRDHLIQNLGDGTFHHSGSLAIRAAVAAGVNITYKLLYNSAVAMTGGQQAVGGMTVSQICAAMLAEGVARIIVTTDDVKAYRKVKLPRGVAVWSRDRLNEAQLALADTAGVTLLIHDQECATELRRKRKRGLAPEPAERIMINERVCEGCGDCGQKSNCLSVQPVDTEFGRKTRIDQSSCNKDLSCLEGDCPSFITVIPAPDGKPRKSVSTEFWSELPEPPKSDTATHTTRITGVGGTGVVTLAQILSAAATLAGWRVRTLDQTGLAQKGGAVVSDIKITRAPVEEASKAAAGECDLYLGCDLLVAVDDKYSRVVDRARTTAVVSTSEVPTGQMVVDPAVSFPDSRPLRDALRDAVRDSIFIDARATVNRLFGTDQHANLLLAGAAVQTGALPLPPSVIEQAISLNGAGVKANIAAFRYGRLAVADPTAFAKAAAPQEDPSPRKSAAVQELVRQVGARPGGELERLLTIRIADLVDYQSLRYAGEYTRYLAFVVRAEQTRIPGSEELSASVARELYKLMAYKDEYEVARLSLDPAVTAMVAAEFGPGARVAYRFHPPFLRALGLKRKISLGPWARPAFRILASGRKIRGSRADLFGLARVRRCERELVVEYREMLDEVLSGLTDTNLALAIEIADLPDMIRGYESIKLANVDRYRKAAARLTDQYASAGRSLPTS
ncbi:MULTISPECIES: indolepyruvate ferredoxin oxidoreductase family protein [unclassified Mycobacterium]|uniref:indolepyruvate ferredoxin oxidoreductase family protein n=1 Tax=unclassified Mycobacterium TaxID=2642494 RepID=UPI00048EBBF5|nr:MULTISPECIES: indolepyruvate ferredoxin oxidoreductase family protein [unclassified Mycobacterium]SEB26074.1 indolepyruvate ferredoxin oxidoreductase [Mycobacterium sp. 283mftsu]